ncbi:MAG: phosphatase PAP2 family protein [Planctomycetaceae bacterium]|nr:phosphatase PAP2 family protein [Planctomycetaceae bacterium]
MVSAGSTFARCLLVSFVLGGLSIFPLSANGEWRPTHSPDEILTTIDHPEVLFANTTETVDSQFQPITTSLESTSASPTSELDRVMPVSSNIISESEQSCCHVIQRPVCTQCSLCRELPLSRFDECLTPWEFLANDSVTLLHNLDDDFIDLWQPENILFTSAGLGLALGMRGSVDDDVREYTRENPRRWGKFSETLGVMGNAEVQVAGIGLLYGYAWHTRDSELMNFTRLLIRSYALTGLSTMAIKAATNTDRPSDSWNDGEYGFPSAHVSLSFAIAATVEEYYGPRAGIPAYLTASLIGWSRIDERDHDLSDVVFGAVLGYAIAKSVAGKELRNDSRIRMFPWTDPVANTYGTMFEFDF